VPRCMKETIVLRCMKETIVPRCMKETRGVHEGDQGPRCMKETIVPRCMKETRGVHEGDQGQGLLCLCVSNSGLQAAPVLSVRSVPPESVPTDRTSLATGDIRIHLLPQSRWGAKETREGGGKLRVGHGLDVPCCP